MSAAERRAFTQEALDLSHWYRSWATLKHGLPDKQNRNTIDETEPEPRVIPIPYLSEKTVSELTSQTAPPPAVPAGPSLRSRVVAGLVGASLLAGGTAAGGLATWLASRGEQPAPVVAPVDPGPQYGDLLLWLNQEGYNLPPETARPQ